MLGHVISAKSGAARVLVVGASFSGYGAVKAMQTSRIRDKIPVIVVDPDEAKNNTSLLGVRVVSGLEQITQLAVKYAADEIVIAMPGGEPEHLREAIDQAARTGLRLKIMPPIEDVTDTKAAYSRLREVNISDLLYRREVHLDTTSVSAYLHRKTVLVTGGGGTIGQELCRQIASFGPARLVILEMYENNAFELIDELKTLYGEGFEIILRLGSVRDMKRLREVFGEFRPDVVFHAAAHKHVLIIEENQAEAVKNNVLGTLYTASAARECGAARFVLISSDKAVNPANAYGATKRLAELVVQAMAGGYTFERLLAGSGGGAAGDPPLYMTVRFGNVLGASGSVLHLFKRQIEMGGPVKITGPPEMVRYFMTIPEACRLVLQAAGHGETGRTLVLDMGEPVIIAELAKKMIMLCGYKPGEDIKLVHTDLRPGDKEGEELFTQDEKARMQSVCDGFASQITPAEFDASAFEAQLLRLMAAADSAGDVNPILRELVPEYL